MKMLIFITLLKYILRFLAKLSKVPEHIEMINQTEKRMMQQQIKYLLDLTSDSREIFSKGIIELKQHSTK